MALKDKKIVIYKATNTTDPIGNQTLTYKPIHPCTLWAYVRQLSAKEYYAAKTTNVDEEMIFQVNWRTDLTTPLGYFIRYGNVWYNIQRIDTFENYKSDLKIYAKLMRTPEEGAIEEYE